VKTICIAGRKGSGKTTLARGLASRIIDSYGVDNVRILPIAAPLKQAASTWGVDVFRKDETMSPFNCTSRQFLQRFGQAMRSIDEDFLVKLWSTEAKRGGSHFVLVDDLRLYNELAWFRALPQRAFCIKLKRQGDLPPDDDVSEGELAKDEGTFSWTLAFDCIVQGGFNAEQTLAVVWPRVRTYLNDLTR
jgi:energy-coupling factor transporter ATP-binding protein EcfA2